MGVDARVESWNEYEFVRMNDGPMAMSSVAVIATTFDGRRIRMGTTLRRNDDDLTGNCYRNLISFARVVGYR